MGGSTWLRVCWGQLIFSNMSHQSCRFRVSKDIFFGEWCGVDGLAVSVLGSALNRFAFSAVPAVRLRCILYLKP